MENIRHSFGINLSMPSIRDFSKKSKGDILYPYKNVSISVSEVYICPFCGKDVHGFECDCKAFGEAFQKLQSSCGDEKHETCFHRSDFDFPVAFSKSISEFTFVKLTKKEVLDLGSDLWDDSIRCVDDLADKSYLVNPATLDNGILYFHCKNLTSKSVYRFEIRDFEYKDKKIFLGVHVQRTIPGRDPRKIGGYSFDYYWKDFRKFEDWNEVCKALNEV